MLAIPGPADNELALFRGTITCYTWLNLHSADDSFSLMSWLYLLLQHLAPARVRNLYLYPCDGLYHEPRSIGMSAFIPTHTKES